MLFHPKNAAEFPSLFVPSGQTFTLNSSLKGVPFLTVRPRTVAALLVLCGLPPSSPPRLSDAAAFETVKSSKGLVDINHNQRVARVGGHSAYFIHSVLSALDPAAPIPSFVKLTAPVVGARAVAQRPKNSILSSIAPISQLYVPVPEFLLKFQLAMKVMYLRDIVVGAGGTLIIKHSPLVARNFLAYENTRVIQATATGMMWMDVTGTLQGGIPSLVHKVIDKRLIVDETKLAKLPVVGL